MVKILPSGEVIPDSDPRAQKLLGTEGGGRSNNVHGLRGGLATPALVTGRSNINNNSKLMGNSGPSASFKEGRIDCVQKYLIPKLFPPEEGEINNNSSAGPNRNTNNNVGLVVNRLPQDNNSTGGGGADPTEANNNNNKNINIPDDHGAGAFLSSSSTLVYGAFWMFLGMLLFLFQTLIQSGLSLKPDLVSGFWSIFPALLGLHTFYELQERVLFYESWVASSSPDKTKTRCNLDLFLLFVSASFLIFADSAFLLAFAGVAFWGTKFSTLDAESTALLKNVVISNLESKKDHVVLLLCSNPRIPTFVSIGGAAMAFATSHTINNNATSTHEVTQVASFFFFNIFLNTVCRLLLAAHFATELWSKVEFRDKWTEMISMVPQFRAYAPQLMSLIILLLKVGVCLLVCGGLFENLLVSEDTQNRVLGFTDCDVMTGSLALVQLPATMLFEQGWWAKTLGISVLAGALGVC